MKITLNKILFVVVLIGAGLLLMGKSNSVPSVDEQIATTERELTEGLVQTTDSPLNNTNTTLQTLVSTVKQVKSELNQQKETNTHLKNELERVKRNNNSGNDSSQIQHLQQKITQLQQEQDELKEQLANQPTPTNSVVSDIAGSDVAPISVAQVDSGANPGDGDSSLLTQLIQPTEINNAISSLTGTEVEPIDNQSTVNRPTRSSQEIVWIAQNDKVVETKEDGTTVQSYPVSFGSSGSTELATVAPDTNAPTQFPLLPNNDTSKAVPIYTIPEGSTLFGSVSMSAILGRVPVDNALSNPFRFKVLIGGENLAANGHYIPNLQEMTAQGYAEGDFTLECARGTIDTMTFVFNDGTIRTVKSTGSGDGQTSGLGWISDKYGVPCISGQYITNFPEFVRTQGALTGLGSLASSLATAASSKSTNADGVTVSVVNDAVQKAAGEGFADGATEMTKWYAERQKSAFDVVYVRTGESVVLNIEEPVLIDYDPEGRKIFHQDNAREYLQW
ncbi:TIGR03752 family integrating conjugative element protein [Vibrio sp.]|uniref:TIGR03752 family integrating conjugative element protein n=1 Tax=Vibrio sp. TaxID=678 RepID=UPI003D125AF8